MKTMIVLVGSALLAASGIHAQQGGLAGKWVAEGAQAVPAGAQSQGGFGGGSGGGFGGQRGQREPFSPGGPGLYPRLSQRIAELDLTVDLVKEAVSGSIDLPGQGKMGCSKLKIVEGRTNGRTLSFTTYRTINGSNVPTRWSGQIDGSTLSLQTVDTLPCNTNIRPGGSSATTSLLPPASSLVYRRGDMDARKPGQPMSAAGRWWTKDSGHVTAVSFDVAGKGQITGSVNVCGDAETRIENGLITGRSITFETFSKTGGIKLRQRWSGNIIDDNVLTLSSQVSTDCAYPPSVSVIFQRGR